MIFFFNLSILESKTNLNPEYLVEALKKAWQGRTLPKNIKEKYKPIPQVIPGTSFLVNPRAVFLDRTTKIVHKAQYIRLAVLMEEVGEIAKELQEKNEYKNVINLYIELIQTAAVCVRWIEELSEELKQ
jgi:hypothetical protein